LEDADAEDWGRDVAAVEALELSDEVEGEVGDVEDNDEYGERAACCLRRESVERSLL